MKKNLLILLLIVLSLLTYFCKSTCSYRGKCNIQKKKLQSYNRYKKDNHKQYIKVSKIENKYIDIKPKEVIQYTLNPKFR